MTAKLPLAVLLSLLFFQCGGDGLPMLKSHVINTAVSKYALTPAGDKLYYLRQYYPLDSSETTDMLLLINELYEYDCGVDSSIMLVSYIVPYNYQAPSQNPFDSLLLCHRPNVAKSLQAFNYHTLKAKEKGWQFDDPANQLSITHTLTYCITVPLSVAKTQICTKEYYIKFRGASTTLSSREAEYLNFPSSSRWVTANNRLIINYYDRLWYWAE